MDYLTKYYKNLSEQLQEKVNFLQRQLNEGNPFTAPRQPSPSTSGSGSGRSSRSVSLGTPKPRQQGGDLVWVEEVPETKPKPKQGGDLVWVEEVPNQQPGKTLVGLSQDQIDAANDPNRGGQSGKFGDPNNQQQPQQQPTSNTTENESDRFKDHSYNPENAAIIRLNGLLPNPVNPENNMSNQFVDKYTKNGMEYSRGFSLSTIIDMMNPALMTPDQKLVKNNTNRFWDRYRTNINPQTGQVTRTSDWKNPPPIVNGNYNI